MIELFEDETARALDLIEAVHGSTNALASEYPSQYLVELLPEGQQLPVGSPSRPPLGERQSIEFR